jgi:hypothetical protein
MSAAIAAINVAAPGEKGEEDAMGIGMSVAEVKTLEKPMRPLPWLIVAGLALLFILGWVVFWHFAVRESEEIIDAWIAREKGLGRIWSCPDRKIEGFPFAIDIACTKPRFEGVIFGKHFAGGLSGFHATARLVHPSVVTAQIAPPFAVRSDDHNVNLKLAWADMQVVLDGLPRDLWHVAIAGDDLTLRGTLEGLALLGGKADRLVANAAERPGQADRSYDFQATVTAASLPLLDRILGAALPADLGIQGTLTEAAFDPALTLRENLEHWRAAGGHIDLAEASLTHSETKFEAHGILGLDETHRLQGELDTVSRGFEPVLRRLGVDPMLIAAGTLLDNLITDTVPSGAKTPPQDGLHVPVSFDGGRLFVGPARTSLQLPPFY